MLSSVLIAFALGFAVVQGKGDQKLDCLEKKLAATAKPMPGRFIPQCEDDGSYSTKQYHGATCYCVDKFGAQLEGSVTPMHKCGEMKCEDVTVVATTECVKQRMQKLRMLSRLPLLGVYVPTCDKNGEFTSVQCHGHLNACWCVDKNGEGIRGTHKIMVDAKMPTCDTPCLKHLARSQEMKHRNPPLLGVFEPSCTPGGDYEAKQCHEFYCFCVDTQTGNKVKGTSVSRKEGDKLKC